MEDKPDTERPSAEVNRSRSLTPDQEEPFVIIAEFARRLARREREDAEDAQATTPDAGLYESLPAVHGSTQADTDAAAGRGATGTEGTRG